MLLLLLSACAPPPPASREAALAVGHSWAVAPDAARVTDAEILVDAVRGCMLMPRYAEWQPGSEVRLGVGRDLPAASLGGSASLVIQAGTRAEPASLCVFEHAGAVAPQAPWLLIGTAVACSPEEAPCAAKGLRWVWEVRDAPPTADWSNVLAGTTRACLAEPPRQPPATWAGTLSAAAKLGVLTDLRAEPEEGTSELLPCVRSALLGGDLPRGTDGGARVAVRARPGEDGGEAHPWVSAAATVVARPVGEEVGDQVGDEGASRFPPRDAVMELPRERGALESLAAPYAGAIGWVPCGARVGDRWTLHVEGTRVDVEPVGEASAEGRPNAEALRERFGKVRPYIGPEGAPETVELELVALEPAECRVWVVEAG